MEQDGLQADVTGVLSEPVERDDILDESLQPLRFLVDVAQDAPPGLLVELRGPTGEELRAAEDRGQGRAQLMGQDADERLPEGLATARLGHVAHDHDGLVVRRGRAIAAADRIRGDLHPPIGLPCRPELDRPGPRPEARGSAVWVNKLFEDVLECALLHVREQQFAGGIRQGDHAGRRAHDDRLAHRPDDRAQLGSPSVLGLDQALESDLGLDPFADVAGDRHDRATPDGQLDRLDQDLDGDGTPIRGAVVQDDGRRVLLATHDRPDEIGEALWLGWMEQAIHGLPDQLIALASQQFARSAVHMADLAGLGVEDHDGLDNRVEERLGEFGRSGRRVPLPGWGGDQFVGAVGGRSVRHHFQLRPSSMAGSCPARLPKQVRGYDRWLRARCHVALVSQ